MKILRRQRTEIKTTRRKLNQIQPKFQLNLRHHLQPQNFIPQNQLQTKSSIQIMSEKRSKEMKSVSLLIPYLSSLLLFTIVAQLVLPTNSLLSAGELQLTEQIESRNSGGSERK